MKRALSILCILFLSMGLVLGGCSNNNQEQEQQQQEEQQTSGEISTLTGEFQGLADSHSAEVIVDGEAQAYQFLTKTLPLPWKQWKPELPFNLMWKTDAESDLQTIIKLYDAPAEG